MLALTAFRPNCLMTFPNKWQHDYHLKNSLTSRATVIGCNDTLIVAFIICSLSKLFKVFPSPAVLLFLSRLCKKKFPVSRFCFCQQIPSADFCSQQIFFLSADSISKFLTSAELFLSANVYADVMEMTLMLAYSVSRQPVSCRKSFRLRPARISLLSRFHSFCRTFQVNMFQVHYWSDPSNTNHISQLKITQILSISSATVAPQAKMCNPALLIIW